MRRLQSNCSVQSSAAAEFSPTERVRLRRAGVSTDRHRFEQAPGESSHPSAMTTSEITTAPAPFPASGRPVLWWPRPRQLLVILLVLVALLGVPPASAESAHPRWEPPVQGAVVEHFAAPPAPWAAGHRGVDLAASAGDDIRSPADGVVSFSGVVVNREVLSIDHGAGYVSSFEPVESELETGDAVSAGAVVGSLGTYQDSSQHCETACLHWGVRLHGEYINPLLMLGDLEPSVLLPLVQGAP